MHSGLSFFAALVLASSVAAQPAPRAVPPIRVAVARLTHGHVSRIWQPQHPDIQIVGIYEPNAQLVESSAKQFGFDRRLVYTDLAKMLDDTKPDALVAFGSIYEHLAAVEAAAPRGVHVMVENVCAAAFALGFAKGSSDR